MYQPCSVCNEIKHTFSSQQGSWCWVASPSSKSFRCAFLCVRVSHVDVSWKLRLKRCAFLPFLPPSLPSSLGHPLPTISYPCSARSIIGILLSIVKQRTSPNLSKLTLQCGNTHTRIDPSKLLSNTCSFYFLLLDF